MSVDWTDRWQILERGVDQLGMRVAGERAYSQLLDFTTTVAWRARYFSFLCWSLERAFEFASRHHDAGRAEVNPVKWRAAVKANDYWFAAATLEVNPDAVRIAGSTKVSAALAVLPSEPETLVPNPADHLQAGTGSHAIYAGPMRLLGLLRRADDIRVERPSEGAGLRLAKAFGRSLSASGVTFASDADATITRSDLQAVGKFCSLNGLTPANESAPQVLEERAALREVILDWANFGEGTGTSAPRLLTIGLVLHVHEVTDGTATLDDFRTATLLDGIAYGGETRALALPPVYDIVRAQWRVYQAYAFATYALECLLCLVVDRALDLQAEFGSGPAVHGLIDGLLSTLPLGAETRAGTLLDGAWWTSSSRQVVKDLEGIVDLKCRAAVAEPDLYRGMWPRLRGGRASDLPGVFHDACVLFLLSVVRLRALLQTSGPAAWIGDTSSSRLPPARLVAAIDDALATDSQVLDVLRHALLEFVIAQHRANALRKASGDAGRFLPKFVTEGRLLIPIERHEPGTSNPRFNNASTFLTDLGYLHAAPFLGLTDDGKRLLAEIAVGAPS